MTNNTGTGFHYDKETGQWYQLVKIADGGISLGDVEVNANGQPIDDNNPMPAKLTGSNMGEEDAIPIYPIRKPVEEIIIGTDVLVSAGGSLDLINNLETDCAYLTVYVSDSVSDPNRGKHEISVRYAPFFDNSEDTSARQLIIDNESLDNNRKLSNKAEVMTKFARISLVNHDTLDHTYNVALYKIL